MIFGYSAMIPQRCSPQAIGAWLHEALGGLFQPPRLEGIKP